jgi:FtsZ-binding cell division protein ZapB
VNIPDEEIKRRFVRLNNLEKLYAIARERIDLLQTENKQLKAWIKELEKRDHDKGEKIEALSFQFEQIKNKIFGKKHILERVSKKRDKKIRDIFSYRRPVPTHITNIEYHPIEKCIHCQQALRNKSTKVFFEEDIPLPIQKSVIKHEVEIGYCTVCKRHSSGVHIPSKKAVLGEHVKKYVCVLSIANRLSHTQIKEHLNDVFDVSVSMGEIGNILEQEANNLRPEYEYLKTRVVRGIATHYDETGWKVQKEEDGKYGWVATSAENNDTVFMLGKNRGKGNIEDIGRARLGITDDYGAYKNAFEEHQLCWAHPQRKLRDLVESIEITEEKREYCKQTYEQFSRLYENIRKKIGSEISPYLKNRFQNLFNQLSESNVLDPTPLGRIKKSLRKNTEQYFTFLKYPGIPVDNNKAERSLRHLVIKRKISLGSKTQKGAETTSILASVIMSLKWNNPQDWFQEYLKLGT